MPRNAVLPPPNPGIKPWESLGEGEKELFVRLQAAYAGFLEHADEQFGRFLDYLKQIDRFDNTLFVVMSDNGASQEGGLDGTLNEIGSLSHVPESLEENLRRIDEIGTEASFTNYPLGWASAGNTPFRQYKNHPFGGGNNDPLIISWEKGIGEKGAVRGQSVDVIDITPTVLDVLGIEAPKVFNGVAQKPLEGTSIKATFAGANIPSPRSTQYFELHGNRAVWHDGWKAIAVHRLGTEFDDDRWELFNLKEDFSEANDIAASRPEKLAELKEVWWREAGKYGVLPLLELDAMDARTFPREVRQAQAAARTNTYLPGQEHLPAVVAPP